MGDLDELHVAIFPLAMNIAVASLFAASFAMIALVNRGYRAPIWFAASYAIGTLTPISVLIMPYSRWPEFFGIISYFSFTAGLLAMTAALAVFYRRPPPWTLIAAIFCAAAVIGGIIRGGARNTLPHELSYQLPFALATAASAWVILRESRRRPVDLGLAAMFGILTLHFPVKALLAVAVGSGRTAGEYVTSRYALFSQASTGVLLVATGLLVLLVALQSVIIDVQIASETDPLSGLANRRGFAVRSARILAQARRLDCPVSLLLLDLDHFKAINDTHGHGVGDRVIQAFAEMLTRTAPQAALAARVGGEEFAALLDRTPIKMARLHAEAIRLATMGLGRDKLPDITVSIGVTQVERMETLEQAMRRADAALYEAKSTGRNRACAAEPQLFDGKVIDIRLKRDV